MDPLSLVTVCALVLQSGPNGLRCNTPIQRAPLVQNPSIVRGETQPGTSKWRSEIAQASARFRIPEAWVGAVMGAESGGHTTFNGQPITSSAGAMGLMQLMPDTYDGMRQRYGFGTDPYNPHDNIFAGAAYLREMYERYGYPRLFGAYNAGPGRYDAYLLNGRPLPAETRAYVEKIVPGAILDNRNRTSAAPISLKILAVKKAKIGVQNSLFFVHSGDQNVSENPDLTPGTPNENVQAEGVLFVPLSGDLHKPEN